MQINGGSFTNRVGVGEAKRTPCVQGGGLTHLRMYAKNPFLHVFCNIFLCKVLLSYFVVFGDDFHCFFIQHLLCIFSCLSDVLQSFSLCNY